MIKKKKNSNWEFKCKSGLSRRTSAEISLMAVPAEARSLSSLQQVKSSIHPLTYEAIVHPFTCQTLGIIRFDGIY